MPRAPSYRLTSRAEADVRAIIEFGIDTHGPQQTRRYVESLNALFDRLATQPGIGRSVPKAAPGTRRHPFGSHVVFFRPQAEYLLVLRILHMAHVKDGDALEQD